MEVNVRNEHFGQFILAAELLLWGDSIKSQVIYTQGDEGIGYNGY